MRKLKHLLLILILVPLMFAQYEIPIENLITNSGFGVWSQSDANKGIASITVDSGSTVPTVGEAVTGATSGATGKVMWMDNQAGNWGANTGTGDIKLGSTTGTFQDNENLNGSTSGANFATVNGDAGVGIKNDPMNNDSTGDWTDDGANITFAFAVAEYTVVTALANQRAWLINASLVAGKIYKIELDIKDGTVAARHVEGYFDDGAAQYGKSEVTAAGWASVSWVFECATTTATGKIGFRVVENMGGGGNNFEIRRFSCYEITPGCTGADTKALDTWAKDATLDIYREHNGANTKDGSFYALKMVVTTASDFVRWPGAFYDKEEWYMQFQGRTVTKGEWVKASTANHAKLTITDSVGSTNSPYHTGGGAYEWLEVTRTIDGGATSFAVYIYGDVAGTIDGNTIIYASQPHSSFGSSIGTGNYSPRQHEWIYLDNYVDSNTYHDTNGWTTIPETDLNIEADSSAMLPKGCKAIMVKTLCSDSASAASGWVYLSLRKDATTQQVFFNDLGGKVNTMLGRLSGIQPCNSNGDVDIRIVATGAGTFEVAQFRYMGVQITD